MPISKKIHRDKFNESQSTFLPLVQLIQEVSRSLQEAQNVQLNNISCQLVQRLGLSKSLGMRNDVHSSTFGEENSQILMQCFQWIRFLTPINSKIHPDSTLAILSRVLAEVKTWICEKKLHKNIHILKESPEQWSSTNLVVFPHLCGSDIL